MGLRGLGFGVWGLGFWIWSPSPPSGERYRRRPAIVGFGCLVVRFGVWGLGLGLEAPHPPLLEIDTDRVGIRLQPGSGFTFSTTGLVFSHS